eukprot:2328900-Pyramimonas_sp.AAC.1
MSAAVPGTVVSPEAAEIESTTTSFTISASLRVSLKNLPIFDTWKPCLMKCAFVFFKSVWYVFGLGRCRRALPIAVVTMM